VCLHTHTHRYTVSAVSRISLFAFLMLFSVTMFGQNLQPSLTEVATYIEENKHLPNVPSAAEVEQNGVDLGEMDKILLQKVEELTLYVIQQQKQIEALQSELKKSKQ
jgi:hypothetical protein